MEDEMLKWMSEGRVPLKNTVQIFNIGDRYFVEWLSFDGNMKYGVGFNNESEASKFKDEIDEIAIEKPSMNFSSST